MRKAGLVLGALLLALVAAAPGAHAAHNTGEKNVIQHVNGERIGASLADVKASACLERYAESWAETMARETTMRHQSTDRLKTVMTRCDMSWIGENVAVGQTSSREVVTAWMRSTGHRDNILAAQADRIGVGYARDSSGRAFWIMLIADQR